jgi:hypothetical protein
MHLSKPKRRGVAESSPSNHHHAQMISHPSKAEKGEKGVAEGNSTIYRDFFEAAKKNNNNSHGRSSFLYSILNSIPLCELIKYFEMFALCTN